MALSDFQTEATIARSRRPQLTRNTGGTTITPTQTALPRGGLLDKVSDVAKQTGSIAGAVGRAGVNFVGNSAVDIVTNAAGAAKTIVDIPTMAVKSAYYNNLQNEVDKRRQQISSAYSSGSLSKAEYLSELRASIESSTDINEKLARAVEGPDAGERNLEVVDTTFNILTLGSLTLAKAGGKQALKVGARELIESIVGSRLESLAMRLPVVRSLILRNIATNAKIAASSNIPEYLARQGKKVAFGLLIKRPLFYQANLEDAREGLSAILDSNVKGSLASSAWLGIQLLDGGPLGAGYRGYTFLKGKARELSYGKGSFIDALSRRLGNNDPTAIARFLIETKGTPEGKMAEDTLRIMQHVQGKIHGDDWETAAQQVIPVFMEQGNMSVAEFFANNVQWRNADTFVNQELQKLVAAGKLTAEQAKRLTPVRWTQKARDALAKRIGATVDTQEQLSILNRYAEKYGFSENPTLMRQLEFEINRNAGGSGDIATVIKEIDAASISKKAGGVTSKIEKKLAKKFGYVLGMPANGRADGGFIENANDLPRLVSESIEGAVDLFDEAIAPQPAMAAIKNLLQKAGLSPKAASRAGQIKLVEAVSSNLRETSIASEFSYMKGADALHGSKAILTKLQDYVEHMKPNKLGRFTSFNTADKSAVTDIRQLTKSEIVEALSSKKIKITTKQAGEIKSAIVQGYIDVPMELRGLGPKLVDQLYKYNPAQAAYSRIQSALRYTYSPFFILQELSETNILSGLAGGNRFSNLVSHNGIYKKSRQELDLIVTQLDEARIFSSSVYGEAAQDQVLGRISANITQMQKRDLAGLASSIAKSKGTDVATLLKDSPDEIADALRIIVQYPNEGILASSLAKTMNIVFFPIRYNTKVTLLAAQALAKQPPVIQKAFIQGMFETKEWLKSDEGIEWQAQHADAIAIFKWITPINSVQQTLALLNGVDSVSEIGLLGGLPLGVITQILNSQGIIDQNTPYVNPKTGDVMPKYIPDTLKARAATALTDLLGSTFTYPGRTLGLPGKGENLRALVQNFIATAPKDFDIQDETDNLTPLQQNMVRVLKGDTSDEAIEAIYRSALPGQYNGFTLPPAQIQDLFDKLKQPERRQNLPSKKTKVKKTKPVATPIQSI